MNKNYSISIKKNLRRWKTIKNVNFNKIQYFFELILIFNLFYKKIKKYKQKIIVGGK